MDNTSNNNNRRAEKQQQQQQASKTNGRKMALAATGRVDRGLDSEGDARYGRGRKDKLSKQNKSPDKELAKLRPDDDVASDASYVCPSSCCSCSSSRQAEGKLFDWAEPRVHVFDLLPTHTHTHTQTHTHSRKFAHINWAIERGAGEG